MTSIERLTSGVFELESWRVDGVSMTPPTIAGRFILIDGTITTILHNRVPKQAQVTSILLGTYNLEEAQFAYKYDDSSTFKEELAGITVSRLPLWEGWRLFDVTVAREEVVFRSKVGHQEFRFRAN